MSTDLQSRYCTGTDTGTVQVLVLRPVKRARAKSHERVRCLYAHHVSTVFHGPVRIVQCVKTHGTCHAAYEDYKVRKYKVASTEKAKTCIYGIVRVISCLVSRIRFSFMLFVFICFKVSCLEFNCVFLKYMFHCLPTTYYSTVPTVLDCTVLYCLEGSTRRGSIYSVAND